MNEQEVLSALTIIVCAYLFTIIIGAIIVDRLLVLVKRSQKKKIQTKEIQAEELKSNSEEDIIGAGKIIGILERAIILTLGLLGEYGSISFVLAAKSMARFKQLEKRQFAEIYLIGTLASFFFALIIAIITKNILIYLF